MSSIYPFIFMPITKQLIMLTNESLQILKDTLLVFQSGTNRTIFICLQIGYHSTANDLDIQNATNLIQDNRPSETLFPEIYNHPDFIKDLDSCAYWVTYPIDVVISQKIKYLELLIAKLQSGFNIGDVVKKKSNKPFKNGEHTDTIIGFTSNSNHPNNRIAAILKDSDTIVCLNDLKLDNTII